MFAGINRNVEMCQQHPRKKSLAGCSYFYTHHRVISQASQDAYFYTAASWMRLKRTRELCCFRIGGCSVLTLTRINEFNVQSFRLRWTIFFYRALRIHFGIANTNINAVDRIDFRVSTQHTIYIYINVLHFILPIVHLYMIIVMPTISNR